MVLSFLRLGFRRLDCKRVEHIAVGGGFVCRQIVVKGGKVGGINDKRFI